MRSWRNTHNPGVRLFLFKICTLCIICILQYLVPEGKLWQDLAVFIFLLFPRCLIPITFQLYKETFLYCTDNIIFFNIWSTVIHFWHARCLLRLPLLLVSRVSQRSTSSSELWELNSRRVRAACTDSGSPVHLKRRSKAAGRLGTFLKADVPPATAGTTAAFPPCRCLASVQVPRR